MGDQEQQQKQGNSSNPPQHQQQTDASPFDKQIEVKPPYLLLFSPPLYISLCKEGVANPNCAKLRRKELYGNL